MRRRVASLGRIDSKMATEYTSQSADSPRGRVIGHVLGNKRKLKDQGGRSLE